MKKVLKKIFVNYGGIIFFYITVIIATLSLVSDYKVYEKDYSQASLFTTYNLKF